jgi:hypothetical protein
VFAGRNGASDFPGRAPTVRERVLHIATVRTGTGTAPPAALWRHFPSPAVLDFCHLSNLLASCHMKVSLFYSL